MERGHSCERTERGEGGVTEEMRPLVLSDVASSLLVDREAVRHAETTGSPSQRDIVAHLYQESTHRHDSAKTGDGGLNALLLHIISRGLHRKD